MNVLRRGVTCLAGNPEAVVRHPVTVAIDLASDDDGANVEETLAHAIRQNPRGKRLCRLDDVLRNTVVLVGR